MIIVATAGAYVFFGNGLPERKNFIEHAEILKQLEPDIRVDTEGLSYVGIEEGMLEFCRYSDVGASETVAVIGDSHAPSAYWGLSQLGKELGYNTVLLGRITPAGEALAKQKPGYEDLAKNTAIVFEVLKMKKDIKKVFIITRGSLYITGDLQYKLGKFCDGVGNDLFKKDLQLYVDKLRSYGKEIFIVSENPELPVSVKKYIYRPFRQSKKEFPTVRKADIVERQDKYLQMLSEINNATIITR